MKLIKIIWLVTSLDLGAQAQRLLQHGEKCFESICEVFPNQITLKSRENKDITIKSKDAIGSYIIAKFSTSTGVGWLCYFKREPSVNARFANAQCHFHKNTNTSDAEVKLSYSMQKREFPREEFWMAVVFELANGSQTQEFMAIRNKFKSGLINREQFSTETRKLEYNSVKYAQSFQDNVWIPFCLINNIEFTDDSWYFDKETSFQDWCDQLKTFEAGRKYLNYYADSSVVNQEENKLSGDVTENIFPPQPDPRYKKCPDKDYSEYPPGTWENSWPWVK